MTERLRAIEERYEQLSLQLTDPAVLVDPGQIQALAREQRELGPLVDYYRQYRQAIKRYAEAKQILEEEDDEELRQLAREELSELEDRIQHLEQEIKLALLPKDPNDERDVIMEIRAGAGGEEAALFAADLFRMYHRYAERKGWKVEVVDAHESDVGGFKEVIFEVKGHGAYSRLKYESGVHRVQRVPVTEASGRIHTSTATVAVLPEVEEVEVHLDPDDLEIEVFRASGPGGQNVQKNSTAVRVIHKPTGLVVVCQDQRSQFQNKMRALAVLRARLYDMERRRLEETVAQARRQQVGTGERAEKIRTYNFPQNRVTDHRIGLTLYNLEGVLSGEDLDTIIDALITADRVARLEAELRNGQPA
ncbi:MAG: peptide chain release factor 1 [Chloroflexota bacterium]